MSTGMTGQSSGRVMWWMPKTYQSTTSVFSIDRLPFVHSAIPVSVADWLTNSPAGQRSSELFGVTHSVCPIMVARWKIGDATVTDAEEKYGLNWHGKRAARQLALTPSTGTLRPCPEESVDWDTTQNLMIEGDNLEVLKLLQKSYDARSADARAKIRLLRVLAYYYEADLKDFDGARSFRREALEMIEAALQTVLPEGDRLEYLFVSAIYYRELGDQQRLFLHLQR